MFDTKKSIIQKVELPFLNRKGIELFVKRDDLIDDFVSGNKWRKLKYNLALAKANNSAGVLTFGGAYSNHLLATAAACEKMGFPAIGIVRGEELNRNSNSVLSRCATLGMDLQFISRNEYALIHDRMYHEELLAKFPNFHIVPEGGANYYGIIGCQEILSETPNNYDHIFVAQGTTTTSAGLVFGLPAHSILHVVPVLKGFDAIGEMRSLFWKTGIEREMLDEMLAKIVVHETYHFGGYGKYTKELLDFMAQFFLETGIPLDPIYTGKTLYALLDWIENEPIQNVRILFVHTGGIAGGKSIAEKENCLFS
jgi:1-aminocyclopropane-1-carboxylate deaminase